MCNIERQLTRVNQVRCLYTVDKEFEIEILSVACVYIIL